ncbi:MAG TPA: formate--tetrahydrofolate ligase [Clostridia bacterium]|nr:formate--tetrahydrofolate ligase [Clostridia bacterium]
MKTDIEIAQSVKLQPITEIAKKLKLKSENLFCFGEKIAKVKAENYSGKQGKVVLVTAINPTPMGEGKTTVAIGLADALNKIGQNVAVALREPSLGPVFGVKGGAAGGGYSQVAPMVEINLHFTGDLHAITAANNLLSAMIDNSIFQGNPLNLNPDEIAFKRCLDINDRALRELTVNSGTLASPIFHKAEFVITAASEVMAIFCLAKDIDDLKVRLGNILIGFTYEGKAVYARELQAVDAMTIILKDAILPNLVQTLEGTPAFIHGGPFANVAHGCNSIIATKTAMSLADIVVTEAGFGADLGAEKFIDIKCRKADIQPSAIVLVASVRALKFNGGIAKTDLGKENLAALEDGSQNIVAHIENLRKTEIPVVVAINRFSTDSDAELDLLRNICVRYGAEFSICECFAKGGSGAIDLATKVLKVSNGEAKLKFYYELKSDFKTKVESLAKTIYGADKVDFSSKVDEKLALYGNLIDGLPVCVAKTQYSFSDNPTALCRPTNYTFVVSDIEFRSGAGYVVAIAGNMLLMFGLPKVPNASIMTIDSRGQITGLY